MKKVFSKMGYVLFALIVMCVYFVRQIKYTENDSDVFFGGLILLAVLAVGGMLVYSKKISEKVKVGIVLLGVALFVSYPIFTDYIVYSHDINFHLVRIEGLAENIQNFQLPAKINTLTNNGYGYAHPMFYPELFLTFPAILRCLNVSMVFAYKLFVAMINILAVFIMYISVKKMSKSSRAGMLSAIIYAAANYRLENVFTRAAVGESLAMCFFPLAIWGLYELLCGDRKKWYVFVIGISGIIQSHILSVMFAGVLCVVLGYVFIDRIIKEKRYKEILISGVAILLLNLWFIYPFLDGYTLDLEVKNGGAGYVFYEYTVIPAQLFNFFDSANAYNLTSQESEGMKEDMSYTLGILCSIGLIVCVYYSFKNKDSRENMDRFIKAMTFIAVLFLVLSTNIVPWKELQSASEFINKICTTMQFSWRLLGIPTFAIAICSGIILGKYMDEHEDSSKDFYYNNRIIGVAMLLAFLAVPYFLSGYSKEDVYITKEFKLNYNLFGQNEYFIHNTNTSKLTENKYETSTQNIKIISNEKVNDKINIEYTSTVDSGYIEVPLLYYPGYVAKDENGKDLEVTLGNNNVVRVNINKKGDGKIKIEYKQKITYILATLVSIVTFVGGIYLLFIKRKSRGELKH